MIRKWLGMWAWMVVSVAAQAGDDGVTPTEIRLGASQVLSGPLGPQTLQYGEGARLMFDSVNAAGGVHGRKITFTTLDDGFDPKRAVENSRKLIGEQKVFMLFNSSGTAQTAAVLPLLKESGTILFGPVTGASSMREGVNPHLFHVRAGYASETERIFSQLKQIGVNRVAFFYQDDGLGKTLLGEVKKASAAAGLPLAAEIKVDPASPDFAAAAAATAQANPQAQFEGFVHARLLEEGMRRAGGELNTVSSTRTLEGAGEIAFGRFTAKYSPKSHNGSNYVELAIIDGQGQLRY